ncbi:MAG: hypothetical protein HY286_08965 [Planctomycetes bacterium]|nr:hypothetical protein [Planctomycetota bacterium]
MENGAFSKEDFAKWGKDYVLFCHITTHIPDMKYDNLLTKVGGQGFPHMVFMDQDGEVLATHEGAREPAAFEKSGAAARESAKLKQKAAGGDVAAKFEWTCRQMEAGTLAVDAGKSKIKEIGKLTADQQKRFDSLLFDAGINEMFAGINSQEKFTEVGKKCLDYLKEKKIPKSDNAFDNFINGCFGYADSKKDADGFGMSIKALRDRKGDEADYKPIFENLEKHLAELKGGGEKKDDAPEKKDKKDGK